METGNKEKQVKKPTAKQLERRLANAIVHVDRTKDTKEVRFFDKGLRLVVNEDYAVVETTNHRHVFDRVTTNGLSRPYLYVQTLIDSALAYENDIKDDDGRMHYAKLFDLLKEANNTEYNILFYVDMWLFTIFQNLYTIGETPTSAFIVYLSYVCGLARNVVAFGEHKEGLTNKQFVKSFVDMIGEMTQSIEDTQIYPPMDDERTMQENIDAAAERAVEDFINTGEKEVQ